jgi:cytoskeletal protein RodZ
MDSIEKQQRKREAHRRLRAHRQRAGQLRGRVVAISLLAFALLWGVVFVQMATGNDPVLGNSPSTAVASHRGEPARRNGAGATEPEEAVESEVVEPEVEVEPEAELIEAEAAEAEAIEAEAEAFEAEPAPVTTSQS